MLDKRPSLTVLFAAAIALAAVIFIGDIRLPLGVAGGVPYVAVVLLGWWLPKRRYIFALATMCTVLIAVGYAYSPPGGVPWVVAVNRFLALFAIWVTAALLFVIRQEERARAESEQRFRDMTEAASDWIWEMGPDLRFTYFSDSFLPISGVRPEAILGRTRREAASAQDQEDPAKWEAHLEDLDHHRPFRDFVYEIVLADDGPRHIKISGKPIFTERGHFMGYRGTGSNVTAQVEAEKRARDAEHQLADAIESLSDGIALYDADERFVMCNTTHLNDHMEIKDVLVPGTSFEETCRKFVERGEIFDLDEEGAEKWVQERLARFRDPGPPEIRQQKGGRWVSVQDYKTRNGGTFIILTDITERKRVEDALRESEERLRTIFETSPIGIAIVSTETNKRLYVNPAMVELFGAASAEQLLAHDLETTYVDPADLERLRAGVGDDFIAEIEIERRRLDGTTWWCLLTRRTIDYEGQKALMALHYDVSGRKRAEDALHESEERFRDLAESAADWFWEMDRDLRFTYVSDRYYEVTGRKPKDIIGKTRLETADARTLEAEGDAWRLHQEVLEQRKPFGNFVQSSQGLSGGRYKGQRYYLRLNGRPRFDENGEFLGYRGTATDITREIEAENELLEARDTLEERVAKRTRELSEEVEERKRVEMDLRRAKEAAELSDRAKSEFLANMSHELRTPLNSIIGFSDMLHSQILGAVGTPKYLEYLGDINASGRHLLDLIRDILDVSKIEAGALDLVDEPVNLEKVVNSSIIMVSERALRAGVAVFTDIPDDLPWLKGDELRIKQILLNLLGNAIKFTPAEGEVTVRAGLRNGGGVFIAVEDTGVGISKKDLERVTEPFAQAASSMTRGHEGTGLGLALVKSLVEMHGGDLIIESKTGEGTEVTVKFPKERTLTAH